MPPVVGQVVGEVVEGAGEARGVGGWVVLGQGPVEVGGFLGVLEAVEQPSVFTQTSSRDMARPGV
ncbi:hypothetical protein BBG13_13125 [Actinomyces oris]|nr:hypothetical protein BBG13_13125 [Actinomyces oris]